jgi:hypothetical protein
MGQQGAARSAQSSGNSGILAAALQEHFPQFANQIVDGFQLAFQKIMQSHAKDLYREIKGFQTDIREASAGPPLEQKARREGLAEGIRGFARRADALTDIARSRKQSYYAGASPALSAAGARVLEMGLNKLEQRTHYDFDGGWPESGSYGSLYEFGAGIEKLTADFAHAENEVDSRRLAGELLDTTDRFLGCMETLIQELDVPFLSDANAREVRENVAGEMDRGSLRALV